VLQADWLMAKQDMKVLYLIDTLAVGGSEQSILAILQRFKYVRPIICHIYQDDTLKPAFESAGIPVISLNIAGKYAFRQAIFRVWQLIKSEKLDILHTTLWRANVIGRIAGQLANIPVVSSFVDESYTPLRLQKFSRSVRWKYKGTRLLDWLTARFVTHFVANSEAAKEANCRSLGVSKSKVSVIYRGRDPTPFIEEGANRSDTLSKIGSTPVDKHIILNVGRLTVRKAQAELIQAMSEVSQVLPTVQLLIAGNGPQRSELERLITGLELDDFVTLLGLRDDIPNLLSLAKIFVFPSYYEGHPGALIEAMFAAKPIVASDIPVHKETIIHKETGLLVPINDPGAIAQGIIWLLEYPAQAKQMGEQAREVALKRFHIDQIAGQHEELYTMLLQRWRTGR
jgi:glycosyltransferase involved in cell wall biosynthesis